MKKIIITVIGKDSVGILAKTCTYLAKEHINILDISQTVTGGFFNMMMIVDVSASKGSFEELSSGLDKLGTEIGVSIKCQKEEIFDMMHRI